MIGVLVSGEGTNLQALLDAGLPVIGGRLERARRPAPSSARRARRRPGRRLRARRLRRRDRTRDEAMADWLAERRRRARRLRRVHAAPDAGVPRALPRPERPSLAPARLSRAPRALEEALAAGVAGDRRHRALRGRGSRHRPGDRPGARGRRIRATRRTRLRARIHEVEHRLLPEAARRLLAGALRSRRDGRIERALISVFDKTGLDALARGLAELGVELVASGGTATFIEELGLPVTRVDELTRGTGAARRAREDAAPAHPCGHPRPARRGGGSRRARGERDPPVRPRLRQPLSLPVGRRPQGRARGGGGRDDRHRRARDAPRGREELRPRAPGLHAGAVRLDRRRAPRARRRSGSRRAARSPPRRSPTRPPTRRRSPAGSPTARRSPTGSSSRSRRSSTSRTARTRTSGRRTTPRPAPGATCSRASTSSAGKQLSFNNLNDLDAARALLREFTVPACSIVKHANPCGCALGHEADEAYAKALARRPRLGVRRRRRGQPPGRDRRSRAAPRRAVRRGADRARLHGRGGRAPAGARRRRGSSQDRERRRASPGRARPAARARRAARPGRGLGRRGPRGAWRSSPSRDARGADLGRPPLRLARREARRLERDRARQGPPDDRDRRSARRAASTPSGSRSRRRASTATTRRAPCSPPTRSSPSRTGPTLALDAGVTALIQPGGSKRDDEVVEAVEQARRRDGLHRPRRHFRH